MKTEFKIIPALLIATALVACGSAHPTPPAQVVALVDISGSAQSEQVRGNYLAGLNKILVHVAKTSGSMTVELIDGNPIQKSGTPLDVDFAMPKDLADNPVYENPIQRKRRADALVRLETIVTRQPSPGGSDVLSAIELAVRVFGRSEANGHPKYLVVFSDMLHNTPELSLYSVALDPGSINRIVDGLKTNGRIPNLNGVKVYVAGAGEDVANELPADRNRAIEAFFRAYLKAAGATVVSYAATLPRFP